MRNLLSITVLILIANTGCKSTGGTEDGSVSERQDSAMKDPFTYGPANHDPKKAPTGVSDKHPGDATAKEEWNRFWNP